MAQRPESPPSERVQWFDGWIGFLVPLCWSESVWKSGTGSSSFYFTHLGRKVKHISEGPGMFGHVSLAQTMALKMDDWNTKHHQTSANTLHYGVLATMV